LQYTKLSIQFRKEEMCIHFALQPHDNEFTAQEKSKISDIHMLEYVSPISQTTCRDVINPFMFYYWM